MKKRLISILLLAAVTLTLLPLNALADTPPASTGDVAADTAAMQAAIDGCSVSSYTNKRDFTLQSDSPKTVSKLTLHGEDFVLWGYNQQLTVTDVLEVWDYNETEINDLHLIGDLKLTDPEDLGQYNGLKLTGFGVYEGDIINAGRGWITIADGTFKGELRVDAASTAYNPFAIQGGTFYQKPDESFLTSGYVLVEQTDSEGERVWKAEPLVFAMDIIGAGSSDPGFNTTLSASYESLITPENRHDLTMARASFMGIATPVKPGWGPTFYLEGAVESTREVILYSRMDLDETKLGITSNGHQWQGSTNPKPVLVQPFEEGVYGDGNGVLYYYTGQVTFPVFERDAMAITYDGVTFLTVNYCHTEPFSDYHNQSDGGDIYYLTNYRIVDHTENHQGKTVTFTAQVSGFNLPDTAESYRFGTTDYSTGSPVTQDLAQATSFAGPDASGTCVITFTAVDPEGLGQEAGWANLYINDITPAIPLFNDDVVEANENYTENPPYFRPVAERYDYGMGPNFGPYNCLYWTPGEDAQVQPTVQTPATTRERTLRAAVTPGSFDGGTVSWTVNGAPGGSAGLSGNANVDVTLGEEHGDYTVRFTFKKTGLRSVSLTRTVEYNDGHAAAPAAGSLTGADKLSRSYIIVGEPDKSFTFTAQAPAGRSLEVVFTDSDGEELDSRDMTENGTEYTCTVEKRDFPAAATAVLLRVKAEPDGLPGHPVTIPVRVIANAYLEEVSVPQAAFKLQDDGQGGSFRMIETGAALTGSFKAVGQTGWTRRMVLEYEKSDGTAAEPVSVEATLNEETGVYTATILVPADAKTLTRVSYEIKNEDVSEANNALRYDFSGYKVCVITTLDVTGVPQEYQSGILEFTNGTVSYTRSMDGGLEFADLPAGTYTYKILSSSGGLSPTGSFTVSASGGTVDLADGNEFPETCSVLFTPYWHDEKGYLSGGEWERRPVLPVRLELDYRDEHLTMTGVTGTPITGVPKGASATYYIEPTGDSSEVLSTVTVADPDTGEAIETEVTVSDKAGDIRYMHGGYGTFIVNGNESRGFDIYPYTKHKVVGTVYDSSATPKPIAGAEVTVIQELNRGFVANADGTGVEVRRKEEVRLTTTTDEEGNFSLNIYDVLTEEGYRSPSAIEIRHPAYNSYKNDRLPTTRFDTDGTERLDALNLRKSSSVAIAVELLLQDADERDSLNNVLRPGGGFTPADSSVLAVSYLSSSAGAIPADQYEVYTVDGQLYIKIAEGVTLTDFIDIGLLSAGLNDSNPDFQYNGKAYQFCNEKGEHSYLHSSIRLSIPEREGEEGIALYKATFRARRMGVEHVATVVEDADSGYVGFLWDQEDYVSGVGTLSLISYSGKHVYAFRIREQDAADMEEMLSGPNTKDFLENYLRKYNNFNLADPSRAQFLLLTAGTPQSSRVLPLTGHNKTYYHGTACPPMPVDNNALPPFIFDYTVRQTNDDSKAMLTGTLRRRWPVSPEDAIPAGIYFELDTGDGQGWQPAKDCLYVGGHLMDGNSYEIAIPDSVEISGEIPQVGSHGVYENKVRFRIQHYVPDLPRYEVEFESPVGEGLSMEVPEELYIQTECRKQSYWDVNKPEEQAQWTVTLPIKLSDPRVQGKTINILDNGVVIDTFRQDALTANDEIFTVDAGYSYRTGKYRRTVRLLNNMQPGIHVLRAVTVPEEEGEEVISTVGYPVAVYAGLKPSTSTDISGIIWNIQGANQSYQFSNLSQIGSKTITVAKKDTSSLSFNVSCPKDYIRKVTVRVYYTTPTVYTNQKTAWGYQLVCIPGGSSSKDIDAVCTNPGDESSRWSASFSMNNFSSFEILVERVDSSDVGDTYEDMQLNEAEGYYERMGATLPDNAQRITEAVGLTQEQLDANAADSAEYLPAVLRLEENDMVLTQDDENGYVVTATAPNENLKELTYAITPLDETPTTSLWERIAREQETGVSLDPNEAGWEIAWVPSESQFAGELVQTYTRTASINRQLPDGTWQNAVRRQVYMPDWVIDAMEAAADDSGSQASLLAVDDMTPEVPIGEAISAQLMATRTKTKTKEEFYQKMHDDCMKGYEFWSNAYTLSDISNDIWTSQKLAQWQRGAEATANPSFISKGASNTMNVVGAVGAVYQYSQGPSGADSTGLRELLRNVRDPKARDSLGKQLDDYDKVRNAIFRQETAMNAVNAGGGFVASNPVVKVGMFLGGIANGIISGWSKDYNQQVYNSTLHDIQRQIQYEGQKELKDAQAQLKKDLKAMHRWYDYKSFDDALRDFVLIRSTSGKLVYVDKCYAPAPKVYIDPSGYVFEGAAGEKLEGVTTTVLYAPVETDGDSQLITPTSFSVWTDDNSDEEERQPNPMESRADGSYGWMVPYGWWKVRYEKEGYLTTESKIMQVPPEHTAVNIGMLSTETPQISVSAEQDGTYTVLFTKYMQLESLVHLTAVTDSGDVAAASQGAGYEDDEFDASTFAIKFFDAAGNPVLGTVTFPDKVKNTGYKGDGSGIYAGEGYATDYIASDWFVRTAVFTPLEESGAYASCVVGDGIVSYSGVAVDKTPKSFYRVRFDPNGGSLTVASAQTGADGLLSCIFDEDGNVTEAYTPTRDGYTFDGWYTAAEHGTAVTDASVFQANATVYAHWTAETKELTAAVIDTGSECVITVEGLENLAATDMIVLAGYDEDGRMTGSKTLAKSDLTVTDGVGTATMKKGSAVQMKAFLLTGTGYTPIRRPALWYED